MTEPFTKAELLDRLVEVETQLESERERSTSLESRLRAVLENDPTSAARAFAWIGRARNSEQLLREIGAWLSENDVVAEVAPDGLAQRITAQLRAVEIMVRDSEQFGFESLDDVSPDEVWSRWTREQGVRTSILPAPQATLRPPESVPRQP